MSAIPSQSGALSEHHHKVAWACRVWVLTFVFSLVVADGLAPGLRGAFIGAGPVIGRAYLLGSYLTQFAAVLGLFLIVYLGVLATRACRSFLVGTGVALLGVIPAAVLYHAIRDPLPSMLGAVAAAIVACIVLGCATQSRAGAALRTVSVLCSAALLVRVVGYLLMEKGVSSVPIAALAHSASALSWVALALMFLCVASKHRPLTAALVLGGSFVPAVASRAAVSFADLHRGFSILGHTTLELTPTGTLSHSYGITLALALASLSVISRAASVPLIAGAVLVVCMFSAITPLGCAAITLCSYLLVILPERLDSVVVSTT